MATTIKLKNSVTTTNAPSSLAQGEVAINVTDKKVWVGNAATTPVQLLGTGADGSFTNLAYTGTLTGGTGVVNLGSGQFYKDASGNIGIGTSSPATKLNVSNGAIRLSSTYELGWGDNSVYLSANSSSGFMQFVTSSLERMRIDSSGNVGIGTSNPIMNSSGTVCHINNSSSSAWATSHYTTGDTGSGATDGLLIGSLGQEAYIFNYENTSIVFGTNATQRMSLDNIGNLLVGTTSAGGAKFRVNAGSEFGAYLSNTSAAADTLVLWNQATSGGNAFVGFYTETSIVQRGSITFNRGAGLVAYNTTSDYRAKDIISPVLNSGEVIDSVPVYMGKMKGATQERPMFIAHETPSYAHTGEKDAVDKDGNPVYQQMDTSSLVPVLWAEIQSLRKRVAQLESK
jgi:hypothetical protein